MKRRAYSTSLLNRCTRPPIYTSSLKVSQAAHILPSLRFNPNPSIFLPSNSSECLLLTSRSQLKHKRLSSHSSTSSSCKHLSLRYLQTKPLISHLSSR